MRKNLTEIVFILDRSASLSADWKKRIDEDYKKRGGRRHK